jgi:hypothetical protein
LADELPRGFYKGEDGIQRFWDGNQWLEPQEPKKRAFPVKILSLGLAAVVAIGAGVFGATSFIQQRNEAAAADAQLQLELVTQAKFEERASTVRTFFRKVIEGCDGGSGVDFDEGNLTVDGKGEDEFSGATYVTIVCIIVDAGMTPATLSRFSNTNSLQGLLEDDWKVLDGDAEVLASWSYHPRSGPSVAMELESVFLEPFDYEKHKDLVSLD